MLESYFHLYKKGRLKICFQTTFFVCSQSSDGKLGAQSRVLFLNLEWTKE